jgi:hypothetical protein
METTMDYPEQPKRRRFLQIASAGSVAGVATGIPALFVSNQAAAEAALGADVFATLTKMARDIFPHDRFDNALYAKAVAIYGDQVKTDAALRTLLVDGVAAANKASPRSYVDIPDESVRVAILTSMASTPFFLKLRGDLVVSLYNQPAVWGKLGYQGPSAALGGYIKRGFNDQTWMENL